MTIPNSSEPGPIDVSRSDVLEVIFSIDNVKILIGRMLAWNEVENEVSHPLRRLILKEYRDELAASISASVRAGNWSPSPAYPFLSSKGNGSFREMCFPSLIDAMVGRLIIDALEPHIIRDDNNRVFFGRSNANASRERGDYENWFKVWLDYTSHISMALEQAGYAYVFATDVAQFFPTIDRSRARTAIAERTRAHHTLLELLFCCLSSWLPRVRYCPIPGLPIEPNDIRVCSKRQKAVALRHGTEILPLGRHG